MSKITKPTSPPDESLLNPAEKEPPKEATKLAPHGDEAELTKAISDLTDVVSKLPAGLQEKLAQYGVVLPAGDISAALRGEYQWGLRCTKCNEIALMFIGSAFLDLNTGQTYDEPQPHMPIHQLPWTQRLPAERINRSDPNCQCCGNPVEKEGDNRFRFHRRLVRLENWQQTRDASFDRRKIQKMMREIAATAGDTYNGIPINDQVKRSFQTASAWLAEHKEALPNGLTGPQALADIQGVDEAFKGQGGLIGALFAKT